MSDLTAANCTCAEETTNNNCGCSGNCCCNCGCCNNSGGIGGNFPGFGNNTCSNILWMIILSCLCGNKKPEGSGSAGSGGSGGSSGNTSCCCDNNCCCILLMLLMLCGKNI